MASSLPLQSIPESVLPEIPAEQWDLLFGWFPSTASECTQEMCQVPATGAAAYPIIGLALLLVTYELSKLVRDNSNESDVEATDVQEGESTEGAAGEDDGFDSQFDYEEEDIDLFGDEVGNSDEQEESLEEVKSQTEPEGGLAEQFPEDIDEGELFEDIETLHQRDIAAPIVRQGNEGRRAQVGKKYRQVLFAHSIPEVIQIGSLNGLFTDPSLKFDLTMHIEPLDREKTMDRAEDLSDSLESSAEAIFAEGQDGFTASDKTERAERARKIREAIDNGQRPTRTSMYVSARADTEQELSDSVQRLIDAFRKRADIGLRTLERQQHKALVSASPVGKDPLEMDPTVNPNHIVLGRGLGAWLASCSKSGVFEPTGHEFGEHAHRGTPILKDPFKSSANYNMICVGESGSGKSVDMKKHALETMAVKEDTMLIMLDPLNGFLGLAEALDAKKITISGKQKLNPLEIKKPPEEHLQSEAWDSNEDPLKAKIKDGEEFFRNFASNYDIQLDKERLLINKMLNKAYERKGITKDVHTHSRESPTLQDLYDMTSEIDESLRRHGESIDIADLKENGTHLGSVVTRDKVFIDPKGRRWVEFVARDGTYIDKFGRVWEDGTIKEGDGAEVLVDEDGEVWEDGEKYVSDWIDAGQQMDDVRDSLSVVSTLLGPFGPGGTHHNLAQSSEDGLITDDDDVVYLDLSQEEGSGGSSTGVMGQLLFSLVYERAKETTKDVVFVIDEARWLLREADTLEFLAQRIRHARHWNTSIRFVTQEMDDFFEHEGAEGIVNNSSYKVIHKAPGVDDWGDKFELNESHKQFVKEAETGDKGYSEALVQFPESDNWYPVIVRMGEEELAVVDFDEKEDRKADLPGKSSTIEESPMVREIRARIRNNQYQHDGTLEEIFDEREHSLFEILTDEDLSNILEAINGGANPKRELYRYALKRVQYTLKMATGDDNRVEEVVGELREELKQMAEEGTQSQKAQKNGDDPTGGENVGSTVSSSQDGQEAHDNGSDDVAVTVESSPVDEAVTEHPDAGENGTGNHGNHRDEGADMSVEQADSESEGEADEQTGDSE